ncbi:MAG: DUF92 domain-containing protein [Candidatus Diapherotrites archaeon]|nr:DUF92 domain-containing protein [Candidatus Diapherotrites archaeon]
MNLPELSAVILVLFISALTAFKTKSLDLKAVILALILGFLVYYLGGIPAFTALVVFFLIGEITTKYSRKKLNSPHETRTINNILGNSGIALLSLIAGIPIGFYGAISSALSDTASAEIGMLSLKKPRLITDLNKRVERGTDGGITSLGLIAGAITAVILGLVHYFFYFNFNALIAISIAGFSGTIIDSILGAKFERKQKLNNNQVNFIAGLCGAIIAVALGIYFQII